VAKQLGPPAWQRGRQAFFHITRDASYSHLVIYFRVIKYVRN